MSAAREDLSASVTAELARRLCLSVPPRVGARWVGATSTVVRWGPELTVKIPHRDGDAVRACFVHAQVSSAARALGVAAPEIVGVEDLIPELDVPLIVSRFLPGDRLAPGDTTGEVWAGVGGQLARLHTATDADMPAGLRVFTQTTSIDPGLMADQLRSAGRLTTKRVRRVYQLRDALIRHVVNDDRRVLCHGDIHAENVIASASHLVGLVDFAGAGWLDAAWDFVGVPVGAVSAMLGGYRTAAVQDTSLLERITWCRLQTALHRAGSSADPDLVTERALDEADQLLH